MSFWELLTLFGMTATILGVFITIHARMNSKLLREEISSIREILVRMEQNQTEARREIAGAVAEARKEMAEAIKYLADLIVAQGEKTRQALKP